jgi:hypothetical protein
MRDERKYVRVYYEVITDDKFAGIYDDDRCLATWLRLLLLADAMWPAPADLPRSAQPKAVALLASVGLIDVDGHRFRIHGLDAERTARSNAARTAAGTRWSNAAGNAQTMPSLAKPSKDKQIPLTPPSGERINPRANGTNPRAVAARQRAERKQARQTIELRYHRGELTEEQRDLALAAL